MALGAVPWAAGRLAGRLGAASDAGTEAVGQQAALSASSHTSHKCGHIAALCFTKLVSRADRM